MARRRKVHPRVRFRRLLERRRKLLGSKHFDTNFQFALASATERVTGKKQRAMIDAGKALDAGLPEDDVIHVRAFFVAEQRAHAHERDRIDAELVRLADAIDIRAGDLAVDVFKRTPYAYSTQTAPETYARAAVELRVQELSDLGARVELVETDDDKLGKAWIARLYALEEVDGEVARRKQGWDLRETVRRMWAAGVNPRVYMPMLPPDFERCHDLHYGRDLRE